MLVEEGTAIVKVFLHVSREEEGTRLQARIEDPEKRWKFRAADLEVRKRFDDYMALYEEAMAETSTEWAPWYVVPADHNWVKALAVATLLVDELERMDPQLPSPTRRSTPTRSRPGPLRPGRRRGRRAARTRRRGRAAPRACRARR